MTDANTRKHMLGLLSGDPLHRDLLVGIKDETERRRIKALVEDYYVGFLSGLLDVQKLVENRAVDLTDLSDGDIPKKEDGL